MKVITIIFLLTILFPSLTFSGEIYGSIRVQKRSIGQGVIVEIKFNNNIDSTRTDKYGSYRIYVEGEGRCTLKVYYGKKPLSIIIFSYKRSMRYDLIIERREDDYILRRR